MAMEPSYGLERKKVLHVTQRRRHVLAARNVSSCTLLIPRSYDSFTDHVVHPHRADQLTSIIRALSFSLPTDLEQSCRRLGFCCR